MVYNTIQHPPLPTATHCLSVYTVHFVWEEGVDVREKVEGKQYTRHSSFVHGGNSSQAGSKIPTMS
jgi:hypothetical protein